MGKLLPLTISNSSLLMWTRWTSGSRWSGRCLFSTTPAKSERLSLSYNVFEPPAGKPRKNPVLMTHGLLGSKQNWNTIGKAVARATTRKVICFDARNHGDSPHSDTLSYNAMSDDVVHLADELEIDKFCLLGHSMGGRTVMVFGLKHPERIEKLIVVDMSPFSMAGEFKQMKIFIDALNSVQFESKEIQLSQARRVADQAISKVTQDPGLRAFLLTNLARGQDGIYWKANMDALSANLGELKKFPPDLMSHKSELPALFMRGAKSDYVPDSDLDKIHAMFLKAQIATIQNSGHWPHIDNTEVFMESLIKYLNEES